MFENENYYAILGVPINADGDMLKRAYRQLARRYHPDLAGPEGAVQMKRINRAYDVLSDADKRLKYDTVSGGVVDLRTGGIVRTRPHVRKFDLADDIEFSGLSMFSTRGPLRTGPSLRSELGVVSALASAQTPEGMVVAAGSLDGKGLIWRVGSQDGQGGYGGYGGYGDQGRHEETVHFAADPALTLESLRELRFSPGGELLAGWGRLGLHVWNASDGTLLWSQELGQRAVSAHYSLDAVLFEADRRREIALALPMMPPDIYAPRQWGVRASDVVRYSLEQPGGLRGAPIICAEEDVKNRQFWAIRLRALAPDASTLLTLSCAHVPGEQQEMAIVRRWDLTTRARFGGALAPRIAASVVVDRCADCAPPYAVAPGIDALAFVHGGSTIRLCDTQRGVYNELASGTMGGSARLALAPGAEWMAVAREDTEANEGVIDVWATVGAQIMQRLYHPWQISALHFCGKQLIVALTDGVVQIWR